MHQKKLSERLQDKSAFFVVTELVVSKGPSDEKAADFYR